MLTTYWHRTRIFFYDSEIIRVGLRVIFPPWCTKMFSYFIVINNFFFLPVVKLLSLIHLFFHLLLLLRLLQNNLVIRTHICGGLLNGEGNVLTLFLSAHKPDTFQNPFVTVDKMVPNFYTLRWVVGKREMAAAVYIHKCLERQNIAFSNFRQIPLLGLELLYSLYLCQMK